MLCGLAEGQSKRLLCQADKSAVSDGGEDQGAEEALWDRRGKNHHVSFGKSRLARVAPPFQRDSKLFYGVSFAAQVGAPALEDEDAAAAAEAVSLGGATGP